MAGRPKVAVVASVPLRLEGDFRLPEQVGRPDSLVVVEVVEETHEFFFIEIAGKANIQ